MFMNFQDTGTSSWWKSDWMNDFKAYSYEGNGIGNIGQNNGQNNGAGTTGNGNGNIGDNNGSNNGNGNNTGSAGVSGYDPDAWKSYSDFDWADFG